MTQLTGPDAGVDQVAEAVTDAILAILPALSPADIRPDAHLKDLGADSVDRVEIIMSVIDRLGIDEPMSSFGNLPDVSALIRFLAGCGSA